MLSLYLVLHVVGNDDADKESESNHAADEDKQVNEDALRLTHTTTSHPLTHSRHETRGHTHTTSHPVTHMVCETPASQNEPNM